MGLKGFALFTVHNVLTTFFERKSRASTIQSAVAIDTAIKALGHVNISLNIATNVSFEDENEDGAVDSKSNDNGIANAVEGTAINDGHAKQEVADTVALPPTAKYSEIWNIRNLFPLAKSCFRSSE
ncbi:hypothetical protein MAM1_0005c00571 [Mucor ambiguus]|uniref:Uncharacterized protein n=1 Tax=Mucor ambiguus TaxID=91626 RepID=A0A0C9LQ00_9FUNG|nr:hypothetical protein MAM1_0005c00571 [Mucor ambiguus]